MSRGRRRPAEAAVVVLIGAAATCGQILFMREVFSLSHGQELTIALVLGIHLLATAAGSLAASRSIARLTAAGWAVGLSIAAALLLPATLVGLSLVRHLLGILPVEYIPLPTLIPRVALLLAPFCFTIGMFFPVATRLLRRAGEDGDVVGAYVFESLGGGVAGLLFYLVLFKLLWPLQIALILGALLVLAGGVVHAAAGRSLWSVVLSGLVCAAMVGGAFNQDYHRPLRDLVWQEISFVDGENSPMGFLEAVRIHDQTSVFVNGLLSGSTGESLSAHRKVTLGELKEPLPRRVLVVRGLGAGYPDVFRVRPGMSVHYLEPDPTLASFTQRHLPEAAAVPRDGEETTLVVGPERVHLRGSTGAYDLVLVEKALPSSLASNRFFTEEFFMLIRGALAPGGLVLFDVESSKTMLSDLQIELLGMIHRTLGAVFADVIVIPGPTCVFAAGEAGALDVLREKMRTTEGDSFYDALFQRNGRYSSAGMERLFANAGSASALPLNRDLEPRAFHLNLARQVINDSPFWGFMSSLRGPTWRISILLIPLVLVLVLLLLPGTPRFHRLVLSTSVAVVGLSSTVGQLLILFGFQIKYGSLYQEVGVIITVFMIGLAGGAMAAHRKLLQRAHRRWALVSTLLLTAGLAIAIRWVSGTPWVPAYAFHALSLSAGMLTGAAFILLVGALEGCFRGAEEGRGRVAGRAYSLDLLGASVGASLFIPLVFPTLGVTGTCTWMALLNVGMAAVLLVGHRAD